MLDVNYKKTSLILIIFCSLNIIIFIHKEPDIISNFVRTNIQQILGENKIQANRATKWIVMTNSYKSVEKKEFSVENREFELLVLDDYLDMNNQPSLHYKSFHRNNLNSYVRKNIGYLIAIENGAEYIYDTDSEIINFKNINETFSFEENDYGLILECDNFLLVNPFSHFGILKNWPKGFPITDSNNSKNYHICGRRKTSLIQHAMINDADFNIEKVLKSKLYSGIKFDETAPSIQYPLYKMGIYDSKNTLFKYDSFWSLYLPKTVPLNHSDIYRSYWAQRLMWMLNGTITFRGPNAFRLEYNIKNSLTNKEDMIFKNLIIFLSDWKCKKQNFYECVIDLSEQMALNKFWSNEEVESIKIWLDDLNLIGYVEPQIINHDGLINSSLLCNNNQLSKNNDQLFPYFSVKHISPKHEIDHKNSLNFLANLCKLSNASLKYDIKKVKPKSGFTDITLLITFNRDIYLKNIEIIKHLYGSFFKNVIFCGNRIVSVINENYKEIYESFTFIEIDTSSGNFHYYCMTKAIEVNSNTNGFLLMSDDVLLKYWELKELDIEKIWYPTSLECKHELGKNNKWYWWGLPIGAKAYDNIFNYFKLIQNGTVVLSTRNRNYFDYYMDILNLNSRKSKNSKHQIICHVMLAEFGQTGGDIFYVPKSKFKLFHFISSIYRKFNLFLELAVPGILSGLEFHTKMEILNGKYNFDYKRGRLLDFNSYKQIGAFFHPFKYSTYTASKLGKEFCEKYIQEKLNYTYL